ncbi:MAG: helix-turn-helix transcriptional regulator, partial [Elusimicrobiota bacterium]|nr:helix-turn-helix transcriptional regulator [Elusimicrobiota bacterium]
MTLDKEPDPLRRIPTKHPTALRAEIGPILRAARLKRGQSLEAVAQQTRISKRFLEALEDNRFEQFPAVVYLRGFLKSYCEHLDVNFEEIWGMLNATPAPEQPAEAAPAEASATPATKAA